MKRWVCPICGYVLEGKMPPVRRARPGFAEQTGETVWIAKHRIGALEDKYEGNGLDKRRPCNSFFICIYPFHLFSGNKKAAVFFDCEEHSRFKVALQGSLFIRLSWVAFRAETGNAPPFRKKAGCIH